MRSAADTLYSNQSYTGDVFESENSRLTLTDGISSESGIRDSDIEEEGRQSQMVEGVGRQANTRSGRQQLSRTQSVPAGEHQRHVR